MGRLACRVPTARCRANKATTASNKPIARVQTRKISLNANKRSLNVQQRRVPIRASAKAQLPRKSLSTESKKMSNPKAFDIASFRGQKGLASESHQTDVASPQLSVLQPDH